MTAAKAAAPSRSAMTMLKGPTVSTVGGCRAQTLEE
jgi:hypothetical protein